MRLLPSSALIACLPLAVMSALITGGCDRQSTATPQPDTAAKPAASKAAAGKIDRSEKGAAMPLDVFQGPDGKPVTLAAFKGRPLLVNLWATWCTPCVKEMPALDRLAARTEGRLRVLSVNQDSNKQATDPVPAFWAKANLSHLTRHRDPENNLGFAYGGGELPTTVLYDASGREVWRVAGDFDWDGAAVTKLVAEASG